MTCDNKAPVGWECTRVEGHEGPCAAVETEPESKVHIEAGANLNHWTLLPTIIIRHLGDIIVSFEWLCWYVEVWF